MSYFSSLFYIIFLIFPNINNYSIIYYLLFLVQTKKYPIFGYPGIYIFTNILYIFVNILYIFVNILYIFVNILYIFISG